MSGAARDSAWLGDTDDWGLSAAKLGELSAELDDHLYCLQADEGLPAAENARAQLKKPASRRKLAGPHLTDQVYATLNRWPTKCEWRELMFLLACFLLILLSDWLANSVSRSLDQLTYEWSEQALPQLDITDRVAAVGTWLLQGAARGGFFAGFIYTLWRAWRLGWGVLLARILQLKLIHTVLVVSALLVLGRILWLSWFYGYGYGVQLPLWLNAPMILIGLVLIGTIIIVIKQQRYWPIGLFTVLTGIFLYAGGPLVAHEFVVTRPLARESMKQADGTYVMVPSTDAAEIAKAAKNVSGIFPDCVVDMPNNLFTFSAWRTDPAFGIWTERAPVYAGGNT